MSKRHNPYTGRSGQMAVVAELLHRGYNVAVPEVDRGDDLYVVHDATGKLSRVQVKSANAQGKKRLAGVFSISMAQLQTPRQPELHYVLALRHQRAWRHFLIIRRDELEELRTMEGIGHVIDDGRRLVMHISFTDEGVECNKISLSAYHENWKRWPEVKH